MSELNLPMQLSKDMVRIPVTCSHQSGLIYVVPSEHSWVCSLAELPRVFQRIGQIKGPADRGIDARLGNLLSSTTLAVRIGHRLICWVSNGSTDQELILLSVSCI